MTKVVKKVMLVLITVMTLALSGCWLLGGLFGETIQSVRAKADEIRHEVSDSIIEGFQNKDIDTIKSFLCPKTNNMADIDEQVSRSFEFIEGDIVSYKISPDTSYEAAGKTDGIIDLFTIGWDILNVITSTGEKYSFYIELNYRIADNDKLGIPTIVIEQDQDDVYCRIGFFWKDSYYYETACLTQSILEAINANDIEELKKLFCKEERLKDTIEEQILAVFNFFDGKATFGETPGNPGYYDRNRDFIVSVTDDVLIKDNEVVQIYLDARAERVFTDTNKEYSIFFKAYLTHEEGEDYQGIIEMKITDGEDTFSIGKSS